MLYYQLDGKIIAPTNPKFWGGGLLQWLEFSKLVGITVQGKGTIDGQGSVWWQDQPFDDPIDDEEKLIVPLNNTKLERPPKPVILSANYYILIQQFLAHLKIFISLLL